MPPTTAELIEDQALGFLVEHRTFSLIGVPGPQELARKKVREALMDRTDEGRVDDAVLVADELVVNAIRHAGGPVSLNLDIYEKGVTVGVADRGTDTSAIPTAPVCFLAELDDASLDKISLESLPENGQGLFLVAQFATAWGVERTNHGKVVTAAFDLSWSAV